MSSTKIHSLQIRDITSSIQEQLDGKIALDGYIQGEVPSGTVNGVNVTFTLANTPSADTEEITINGINLKRGAGNDYTMSGGTITFSSAPETNDIILVNYVYGATGSPPAGEPAISSFDWTTTEQEYPLEILDGETLYAKIINIGSGPNNGVKSVAHGVSNMGVLYKGWAVASIGVNRYPLTLYSGGTYFNSYFDTTYAYTQSNGNQTTVTVTAYMIYTKTA